MKPAAQPNNRAVAGRADIAAVPAAAARKRARRPNLSADRGRVPGSKARSPLERQARRRARVARAGMSRRFEGPCLSSVAGVDLHSAS
jgi:hypothetical protein